MKKMKRVLGLLMALVLVFSLSSMALAAEPQPLSSSTDTSFTITVNPAYSGETYTAYKIFDVTYSDEDSDGNVSYSYTIEGDSAWYNTVSNSGLFTLTQITGTNTYVVVVNDDVTGEQIAAALSTIPDGAVVAATATPEFEDNADGSSGSGSVTLDVTSSGAGYYFVTTSLGSVVSIDTTNPTATIADKNPVPGITKQVENVSHNGELEENGDVTEGTEDTAKVGDILEYEITITEAAHKSALCLHDTMTSGLTYYGSEHIHVYLNSVSTPNLVSDGNYTIQDSECEDGCDFEIVFDPEWLDTLSDTDVIIVTYEAVVNEDAVEVNGNDAHLTYGTNGYSVSVTTETDVYGLDLEKVDGDGNELDGATFTLAYGDSFGDLSGTLVEFYFDGTTYTVHDAIDQEYAGEETTTDILVGSATIFGLDAGTYTLTETEAPDGYNKLTSAITVTIAEDGTVTISGNDLGSVGEGTTTITVVNNAGSILPGTGGIGTTIFYIIGIIIVAGVVVLLITRRRMNTAA